MSGGILRRVADPTDSAAVRDAVIDTYGSSSDLPSAALVAQYNRVQEYCAEHPTMGSSAVATALELPRGRIRSWVDGDGRPDAIRGIERLDDRGWLHHEWGDTGLQALAGLVAWIIGGGSIAEQTYVPAWSVSEGTAGDLRRLGEALGIGWSRRDRAAPGSGDEWIAAADGSALGRLLAVLGAPVSRNRRPALPPWLLQDACPRALRLDVARVLVRQRGTARREKPTRPVHLTLGDPNRRGVIRGFLCDVVGREDAVHGSDDAAVWTLDAPAAELLGTPPTVGDPLPGCE